MSIRSLVAVALAVAACGRGTPEREIDIDAIRVPGAAKLRTDTVGEGKFASQATFVLVDAENTASEGAFVTLSGELTDATKTVIGRLKPQSLWIPAGERRTFALVDSDRQPRPASTSARIIVNGAVVASGPPRARVTDLHSYDDYGKTVLQANLVNDADRIGDIMVIASFYDRDGEPMTRPFQMVKIDRKGTRPVQFVGPPGSTKGMMFVGDVVY